MKASLTHYKYMAKLEAMHANIRSLTQVLHGVRLQKDIQSSVEKFGLSKATWMAIQHQPAARALFDVIPSMESLSAVGNTDVEMKATKKSTSAVVADWLDNTADGLNDFTSTAKYHLDGLACSIDDAADTLKDHGHFRENYVVYAAPASLRLEQCDHLTRAAELLRSMDLESLDSTSISEALSHLSEVNGMCKMGYDNVPGPAGMYCVEELEEGSFAELGYTFDNLLDLSKSVVDLIDDVLEIIKSRGEELMDALNHLASEQRALSDGPSEDPQPVEDVVVVDETDISQEDVLDTKVDALTQYTTAVTCFMDCVGHIALNTLNTVTEATKAI